MKIKKRLAPYLNRQITIGLFLLVLVLCTCVLSACDVAQKSCVEAAVNGLQLCLPSNYFRVPFEYNNHPASIAIGVPVTSLPIIPDNPSYGGVMIELHEEFESFANSKVRTIEIYGTTHSEPTQENGMTVLTIPHKNITFWTDDILFPSNGDQAYFICARRWVDRSGKVREPLCAVSVDWDAELSRPRVRLVFNMQRKDIAHWKEIETKVRAFLKIYTINLKAAK